MIVVSVEFPNKEVKEYPWDEGLKMIFDLAGINLENGKVHWVGNVAYSLEQRDENDD